MKKTYKSLKAILLLMGLSVTQMNAQYCTSQATSTFDDEIFNVSIGTLNNTSSCAQTGGPGSILNEYSNWTNATPAVAAPVLIVGTNYPMTVRIGQCSGYQYGGYFAIWIDYNANGLFTDPGENVYTSGYNTWPVAGATFTVPGGVLIPLTATPGITRMRVSANESGVPSPCANFTWGEVEDYNVNIGSGTPCSGVPGANSVITPTAAICPNSATGISLANSYTVGGITYQWQSGTVSAVGPFASIANATLSSFTTPSLTIPTYYTCIITCTNGMGSVTATSGSVAVQPITISNVPYLENFEGISANNKLPNCSWQASNLPSTCQTYISAQNQNRVPRSGSKFASFYYSPAGNNYFFTNGIQLNAGVTYSTSMWYTTEYYGYNTYNLNMWVGPNQSTVGANVVATTGGVAASPAYKSLSNTFTVATSGIYYVGINAISNGACCGYYLSWDDLEIIVPCQLNTPAVVLNSNVQTICAGQSVNLTATGADTYTWNTGATTNGISVSPNFNTMYTVVGMNSASGCTASVSQMINVNPAPFVSAIATTPTICAGKSTNLIAFGANTYTWSNNTNGSNITVSPAATTAYTVIGSNSFGCSANGVVSVVVNPNPVVSISPASPGLVCEEDQTTFTGAGGTSYQWASSTGVIIGNPITVSPNSTETYSLTGTDANGCVGTSNVQLNVTNCVGIRNVTTTESGIKLYPNPNNGVFTIELNAGSAKSIEVTDITGRVIMTTNSADEKVNFDLSNYSKGVYYVKVVSQNSSEVIKVVKQ